MNAHILLLLRMTEAQAQTVCDDYSYLIIQFKHRTSRRSHGFYNK
jgi:hypothetical protein